MFIFTALAAANNSFDFTKFFNLEGVGSGDATQIVKAVVVLVLNIFLQILVVFEAIAKVILGLLT